MGCCSSSPLQYPPDVPQSSSLKVYKTVIAGPAFAVRDNRLFKSGNGTFMITSEGIFYYGCFHSRFIGLPLNDIKEVYVSDHFEYRGSIGYAYHKPCGCLCCNNACAVNSFIHFKCDFHGGEVGCSIGVVNAQDLMDDIRQYIPNLYKNEPPPPYMP